MSTTTDRSTASLLRELLERATPDTDVMLRELQPASWLAGSLSEHEANRRLIIALVTAAPQIVDVLELAEQRRNAPDPTTSLDFARRVLLAVGALDRALRKALEEKP